MSDTPTLAEALALADRGGPEWDSLLARMESPKPWKHNWRFHTRIEGRYCCTQCPAMFDLTEDEKTRYYTDQRQRLPGCTQFRAGTFGEVCEFFNQTRRGCPVPDPVTEPLPCIVDRKVRVIDPFKLFRAWDNLLGCGWTIQGWFKATPAQQLVCLWKAEGRLAERREA